MRARMLWIGFAMLAALVSAPSVAAPAADAARPETGAPSARSTRRLRDTTVVERWRLANGLEVATRDIPGAAGVAITVGYRLGSGHDAPGREGFARVLAEVAYTAAAGDVPERTREEMSSLRPLGWDMRITQRLTLLSELASREQFPGVLRQVATRMRSLTVDEPAVKRAIATVKRDLGQSSFGTADLALYYHVRELGQRDNQDATLRIASGKGIDGLTAKDVSAGLKRWCVPANAALSLVGDFQGIDVPALIEREFGTIPAGERQSEAPGLQLTARDQLIQRDDVTQPVGVLGGIAPAIGDSLHPAFFLGVLVIGSHCRFTWGPPGPPLTTRFQYSIFDEPELVRFYPPVKANTNSPQSLSDSFNETLDEFSSMMVQRSVVDGVKVNLAWLLGAEMPPEVMKRMRTQPGALNTAATNAASRILWGGDAFWADYLRRFETTPIGPSTFARMLREPERQIRLLFMPKR